MATPTPYHECNGSLTDVCQFCDSVLYGNQTQPRIDCYDNLTGNKDIPMGVDDNGDEWLRRLAMSLDVFGIPIVIFVGVGGNLLAIATFCSHSMRRQSSNVYLMSMSIVDTGFLFSLFFVWLGYINVHSLEQEGWCQIAIYITYVTAFLSVWIVVSFTLERYIVVYHPLRRGSLCTRRRAGWVVVGLTLGAMGLYSFSLWTSGVVIIDGQAYCISLEKYFNISQVLMNIDAIVTMLIPSLTIIVVNSAIILKVYSLYRIQSTSQMTDDWETKVDTQKQSDCEKQRKKLNKADRKLKEGQKAKTSHPMFEVRPLTRSKSSCLVIRPAGQLRRSISAQTSQNFQMRTTRALLILSSAFVILNLPSHTFRLYAFAMYLLKGKYHTFPRSLLLWQHIFNFLYYINFATNFFFYIACSKNFRQAAKKLFSRITHHSVCLR